VRDALRGGVPLAGAIHKRGNAGGRGGSGGDGEAQPVGASLLLAANGAAVDWNGRRGYRVRTIFPSLARGWGRCKRPAAWVEEETL